MELINLEGLKCFEVESVWDVGHKFIFTSNGKS